jgi:hypothetical protein
LSFEAKCFVILDLVDCFSSSVVWVAALPIWIEISAYWSSNWFGRSKLSLDSEFPSNKVSGLLTFDYSITYISSSIIDWD